ncbi:MAG: hypothetical protein KGP01_07150, partial [Actinomycetales bacterium]|nr:hypothetical protein [Actinomycetales bacterium]
MSHPGHVPMTRYACAAQDPAPAVEELLGMNARSMLLAEIFDALQQRWSQRCLGRMLLTDPRFARVGPNRYVLRTDGVIEYRGLAQEMRAILRHEGVMQVKDLAAQLSAAFGVPEEDVRRAAYQRPFACAEGAVRLMPSDCAPPLWILHPSEQQSVVQVKGGFTIDIYIKPDDVGPYAIEVPSVVASVLQLGEETPAGVPVVATHGCGADAELEFFWDGDTTWMQLPASFTDANPLTVDAVVRLHLHGLVGRIRAVSLHLLPAEVAVEQHLLHQRVASEPVERAGYSDHLRELVETAQANCAPNRTNATLETMRLAVEALLLQSRAQVLATVNDGGSADTSGARPRRSRGSQPGYGRITIAVEGGAGVFDPYVRWQWRESGELQLEFAVPTDPVREASQVGVLIEKMAFARMQEGPLFRYGRIMRPGEADLVAMSLLIMRVLRDVVKIN